MTHSPQLEFIDEPIFVHVSPPLRIGTDCSGIEAPVQALRQLGIPHRHVWSSDIDKYCIQSIKANYHPEILFGDPDGLYPNGDITKRDNSLLPDIDLYVCGFPCQPFSCAGKRKGFEDKRGNVFWSCLDIIEKKQPKYFILENVKGILWHDKENKKEKYGRTWLVIWESLQELSKYGYTIKWKVLNTKDYGIPQNRERVYIVGVKEKDFEWPEKVEMDDIRNYVDWKDNIRYELTLKYEEIITNMQSKIFVDLAYGSSKSRAFPNANLYSGCITANSRTWNASNHRYANITELLSLQGFSTYFNIMVSKTRLKKQVGNSMSVNVVKVILKSLL